MRIYTKYTANEKIHKDTTNEKTLPTHKNQEVRNRKTHKPMSKNKRQRHQNQQGNT